MIPADVSWKYVLTRLRLPPTLLRRVARLVFGLTSEELEHEDAAVTFQQYVSLLFFSWLRAESGLPQECADELVRELVPLIEEQVWQLNNAADLDEISPLLFFVVDKRYVGWTGATRYFQPATGTWHDSLPSPGVTMRSVDLNALINVAAHSFEEHAATSSGG